MWYLRVHCCFCHPVLYGEETDIQTRLGAYPGHISLAGMRGAPHVAARTQLRVELWQQLSPVSTVTLRHTSGYGV